MKTILIFGLIFFSFCMTAISADDFCPNECKTDRSEIEAQCYHDLVQGLCVIKSCSNPANGYICLLPEKSFIIPNTHLPNFELVVEYSWSQDQTDLDTSTRFLNGNVGWSCSPDTPYVEFSGDNTSAGGKEYTVVDVAKAFADGKWSGSTAIYASAGWHGFQDEGDVTLKAFIRRKSDSITIPGASVSKTVSPGVQTNCASTLVGTIDVVRGKLHTRFTLRG